VLCTAYPDACKQPARGTLDLYRCRKESCPGRIRFGSFPSESVNDVSGVYRSLFGPCPLCGRPMDGHEYCKLASAIVAEPSSTSSGPDELAQLVSQRRWREAAQVTQWAHDADVREYFAIRCPRTGRLGLVTVMFTHEFWSNDLLEEARALPEEDGKEISTIVGDRWRTL
jgi:sarcosine oxidase delta subunit